MTGNQWTGIRWFLLVGWLAVGTVVMGCIAPAAPAEDWWYNHQEEIPPEAACPPGIDFVVKFPSSWAIERKDCEQVWVKRRDKKGITTINIHHVGAGEVPAKLQRHQQWAQSGGNIGTLGGISNFADGSTTKNDVLLFESSDPPYLRTQFKSGFMTPLGGCEGDVVINEMGLGRDSDKARYFFHIAVSICEGHTGANVERIGILDSVRFIGDE